MLVVGADFLFSKLKKKHNTDILKIGSQKKNKSKSNFFSFPTKNKILIGLVLVWIALLIYDLNNLSLNGLLQFNYNEILILIILISFLLFFSVTNSLKKNNLDSDKNIAREVVFTVFSIVFSITIFYTTLLSTSSFKETIEKYVSFGDKSISAYYGSDSTKYIYDLDEEFISVAKELNLLTKNEEYYENIYYDIFSKFEKYGQHSFINTDDLSNLNLVNEEKVNALFSVIGRPNNFVSSHSGFYSFGTVPQHKGKPTNLNYSYLYTAHHFNEIKIQSIKPKYLITKTDKIYFHSNYVGPYETWYGTGNYYYSTKFGKYFSRYDVWKDKDKLGLKQNISRKLVGYDIKTTVTYNLEPEKFLKLPRVFRSNDKKKILEEFDISEEIFDFFYKKNNSASLVQGSIKFDFSLLDLRTPLYYGYPPPEYYYISTKVNYAVKSIFWELSELVSNSLFIKNNVFGFVLSFLLSVYALRLTIFILVLVITKLFSGLRWSFKTYFSD